MRRWWLVMRRAWFRRGQFAQACLLVARVLLKNDTPWLAMVWHEGKGVHGLILSRQEVSEHHARQIMLAAQRAAVDVVDRNARMTKECAS